ncbi:MAG TPA: HisA/HisF-related TIM barrel protein, partial [Bacteroidales bacterium]|nr:HisA/HisF-related TIM barrel protein [Bacteroidales bacterium]
MVNIIPAIDIISGECVRLSKGKFSTKKVYSSSPVEVAKVYSDLGCRRLHIVDLDGARSNHPENLKILEQIASVTQMDIQFGGGIKDENSLISALNAGASRVICGSVAIYDPELFVEWLNKYGSQRVILGAD